MIQSPKLESDATSYSKVDFKKEKEINLMMQQMLHLKDFNSLLIHRMICFMKSIVKES